MKQYCNALLLLLDTISEIAYCNFKWPISFDSIYSICLCVFYQSVQNFINQTWTERYNTEISTQMLTLLWSTIVSIFTLGGLVGASVGGTLAIRFGRWTEDKILYRMCLKNAYNKVFRDVTVLRLIFPSFFQERDTVV